MTAQIGTSELGDGTPQCVIASIGLNRSGTVDTPFQIIDIAADAGAHVVTFPKRTPAISSPELRKNTPRNIPGV